MERPIAILKAALEDRCPRSIRVITRDKPADIQRLLSKYRDASYFSEWRVDMAGPPRYTYRAHGVDLGKRLLGLYAKGVRSSLPRLTAVYNRNELSRIARCQP